MVVFCACTDAKYHIAKICKNSQRWECWVFAAFVCWFEMPLVPFLLRECCIYFWYTIHATTQSPKTAIECTMQMHTKSYIHNIQQQNSRMNPGPKISPSVACLSLFHKHQTSTEKNIKPVLQLFHLPNNPPTPWKGERAWESRCSHVFARLMVDPDALNIPALFVGCGEAPFRQIRWRNIFFKN